MNRLEVCVPAAASSKRHNLETLDGLVDLTWLHAARSAPSIPDLIEGKTKGDSDLEDCMENRVVASF